MMVHFKTLLYRMCIKYENRRHQLINSSSHPTMASTNDQLEEAIRRLSRNDATLTTLDLLSNDVGDEGAGRLAAALATNSILITLDLSSNQVGDEGAARLAEALAINSSLTTLDLWNNEVGDEAVGRLAEALATNSSLTQVHFDSDMNTRLLADAHLDRNKENLEKKSASLCFMLLPSLSLGGDEPSE